MLMNLTQRSETIISSMKTSLRCYNDWLRCDHALKNEIKFFLAISASKIIDKNKNHLFLILQKNITSMWKINIVHIDTKSQIKKNVLLFLFIGFISWWMREFDMSEYTIISLTRRSTRLKSVWTVWIMLRPRLRILAIQYFLLLLLRTYTRFLVFNWLWLINTPWLGILVRVWVLRHVLTFLSTGTWLLLLIFSYTLIIIVYQVVNTFVITETFRLIFVLFFFVKEGIGLTPFVKPYISRLAPLESL